MSRGSARAALAAALLFAAAGCYTGSARDVSARQAASAARDPAWQLVSGVPFVAQKTDRDCGPAALAMVLAHFGVAARSDELVTPGAADGGGVRAGDLRDAARRRGLEAFVVSGTFADLFDQVGRGRPVLVGLAKPMSGLAAGRGLAHYEVVVGINRSQRLILSLDPARGLRENTLEGFAREWAPTKQVTIVVFPRAGAPAPASAG